MQPCAGLPLHARCRLLGDHQAARDLDQDTLDTMRRVLGDDHPRVAWSARLFTLENVNVTTAERGLAVLLDACERAVEEISATVRPPSCARS